MGIYDCMPVEDSLRQTSRRHMTLLVLSCESRRLATGVMKSSVIDHMPSVCIAGKLEMLGEPERHGPVPFHPITAARRGMPPARKP
jgi:hypothetical protein